MKPINSNKNYKTRVIYANKITKTMVLTGQQIIDRRKINENNKKPYIKITVLEQV